MEKLWSLIGSTSIYIGALCFLGVLLGIKKAIPSWKFDWFGRNHILGGISCAQKAVERLAEIRLRLEATRAYVFQFHNGEYYSNGSSILRMSCTHESVAPGRVHITEHSRKILVSTVTQAVSALVDFKVGDDPVYTQTKDLPPGYYKNILTINGVLATLQYPLYKNNDIIGYLGADFSELLESPDASTSTDGESNTERDLKLQERFHVLTDHAAEVEYWVNKGGKKGLSTSLW